MYIAAAAPIETGTAVVEPICCEPFRMVKVSVPSLTVIPAESLTVALRVKVWSVGL